MRIKILSYNIHKGFDWKNDKYYLSEIKKLIIESGAELVFLQEVVGENFKLKDKGLIDSQFEFLSDNIWPHFSYGKNAIYDHGHHGNLILSKYPIENYENFNLSTNPFEQRGMLTAKINTPGFSFFAACIHLNLLHSGRVIQYGKIERYIDLKMTKENLPFVVAGDFNDWNRKSSKSFEKKLGMIEAYRTIHGRYSKTYPAIFPLLSLDRIYVKNFTVIDASVILHKNRSALSDHLPLICEVVYNET